MPQDNYHEILRIEDIFPRRKHQHGWVIDHGYAVQHDDGEWFYFLAIEPALAYGRAGRMSVDISSYGVHKAAREIRWDERRGIDILRLHVGENIDRGPDEMNHLHAWVKGINAKSSHWPIRREVKHRTR
jgi:hypothetical protein